MNEIHLLLNTANRCTNPNVSKGHNTVAHLQDLVQKSPWQSSLSNHKPEESTNITTIQTDLNYMLMTLIYLITANQ